MSEILSLLAVFGNLYAAQPCWASEDTKTIYAHYTCHYILNDWGELAPTFQRIGRKFDYSHFRRSDNVEDNRSDGVILMDNISPSVFRREYLKSLDHHDKLPSIIAGK